MAQGLGEKERVRNLLGKVVSPAIAEELLSKELNLGGEEMVVTVLFSDVRSFTSHSEVRSPSEVLDFLNVYLTTMSRVIEDHGGVVDKYIGDAIMALYGAPLGHDDDPERAVQTAVEMIEALDGINDELAGRGLPEIKIGVGVNTDNVVAGNMGSENRMNYTVIGDGVNLAARLEGVTKQYGVKILISEKTMNEVGGKFLIRELDIVRVAGKKEPVRIYEPLAMSENATDSQRELVTGFQIALETFRRREYENANELFKSLNEKHADKVCELYLKRLQDILILQPPDSWDMVYDLPK